MFKGMPDADVDSLMQGLPVLSRPKFHVRVCYAGAMPRCLGVCAVW